MPILHQYDTAKDDEAILRGFRVEIQLGSGGLYSCSHRVSRLARLNTAGLCVFLGKALRDEAYVLLRADIERDE